MADRARLPAAGVSRLQMVSVIIGISLPVPAVVLENCELLETGRALWERQAMDCRTVYGDTFSFWPGNILESAVRLFSLRNWSTLTPYCRLILNRLSPDLTT